ncbi:MAG: response regulator, partial [Colwellia sp.]
MKKILLVEDDTAFANTLMRRLTKHNFECMHVETNSEALLACHRHQPSYVLLDMKLAKETTLNIITPIRQSLPDSRLILLTGFASIATAVDAIKLGADDYLTKPLDTQTLLAALNKSKASLIPTDAKIDGDPLSTEQVQWQHIQQVLKANDG